MTTPARPFRPRLIGTTEECLRHLAETHNTAAMRAEVMEFCGVKPMTVGTWFTETGVPDGGERLLRLRVFLTLAGYRVTEFDAVDRARKDITYAIAFGLENSQTACQAIGYRNSQQLWLILYGSNVSDVKMTRLSDFGSKHRQEIPEQVESWQRRIRKAMGVATSAARSVVATVEEQSFAAADAVYILAGLISATDTTAEKILASPDLGAIKRLTANGQTLRQLSERLTGLLDLIGSQDASTGAVGRAKTAAECEKPLWGQTHSAAA